jgi:P27 family predicted phage terminase small subunit
MGTVYRIHPDTGRPGAPACPPDVADDVRAIWDHTIAQLPDATGADRDALLAYCEAVATHRKASAILARSPVLVPGALKGIVVQNPAVRIQRDAANVMHRYATEFGLTPLARTALAAAGLPAELPHLRQATS